MGRQFGIGVIGMGWMGLCHSRAYLAVADRFRELDVSARLVHCADDVLARAEEAKDRLGFTRVSEDWHQVLHDPDVDIVNITTPNARHLEMVREATAAGKHVFCEKPVGCSPHETATIERLAREAGVKSWVGYNYRWVPVIQHARRLITDGRLGTLTHFRGRFLVGYGRSPRGLLSWRFQREHAGTGASGDLMSHVVDMAHHLVGPIASTCSHTKTWIKERPLAVAGKGTHFSEAADDAECGPVTNEDSVSAICEFANGARGTLEVCRIVTGPRCEFAIEVNGTKGEVRWNFERMNELQVVLADAPEAGPTNILASPDHPGFSNFYPGSGNGMGYEDLKAIETARFLEALAADQQGAPGFAEARRVAEVLSAMQTSWDSQSWENVVELADD